MPVAAQVDVDESPQASGRTRPTADRRGTIPQRLNYLFEVVHAPGVKPYSAAHVAKWINDNGGQISSVYINKILDGDRMNPSTKYLVSLAEFFAVEPSFFLDTNPPELDGATQNVKIIQREPLGQRLMRALQLSARSQKALNDIIDSLLLAEGKDL